MFKGDFGPTEYALASQNVATALPVVGARVDLEAKSANNKHVNAKRNNRLCNRAES